MRIKQILMVVAIVLATSLAFANTFTGTVTRFDGNMLPAGYAGPGTPEGTFTSSTINFLAPDPQTSGFTLGDFLSYGGANTSGITGGLSQVMSNCFDGNYSTTGPCYSTGIMITGIASFNRGTITHDDGVLLYVDGALVVNSAAPTSPTSNSFTLATGGPHNITLYYMGTNGNPEVLALQTPEPASLLLLGTGLAGLGLRLRRRK